MISNIFLTAVWVKNIEVKRFYIDMLGFEEHDDVTVGDDFRWCTVGHPSQPELQVHLTTPGPPISPGSPHRSLCPRRRQRLRCRLSVPTVWPPWPISRPRVVVLNLPEERPYGVEALIRQLRNTSCSSTAGVDA